MSGLTPYEHPDGFTPDLLDHLLGDTGRQRGIRVPHHQVEWLAGAIMSDGREIHLVNRNAQLGLVESRQLDDGDAADDIFAHWIDLLICRMYLRRRFRVRLKL